MILMMTTAFCVSEAGGIFLLINPGSKAQGTGEAQVGRADDAYAVMRELGLGISTADLQTLQTSTAMKQRLAGRILLAVEQRGEAYYINPDDLSIHYLQNGEDAYELMRELGLGALDSFIEPIRAEMTATRMERGVDRPVPFVAQAPFANWADDRQQEACEETSVLMALEWAKGAERIDREWALEQIIATSEWQLETFGYYQDTSITDTASRLVSEYYGFSNYEVVEDITTNDILAELKKGNILIVATDGTEQNHDYFVPPGPERHTIVVHDYDHTTGEFLYHDPGTARGANIRATAEVLDSFLRDYPSGVGQDVVEIKKNMIIIRAL